MGAGTTVSDSSSASENFSQSVSEYFSRAFGQNTSSSQNSSSSQNTSTSQNSSESGTYASELSQTQLGILQNRENQYQNYFFPELQKAIDSQTAGSAEFNAQTQQAANQINAGYNAAQKATEQTLAQQGLSGSPTGVEAALKAANNRARSSSLAQAYYNQLTQGNANKASLLGTMGNLMTTPTNSAEYYNTSKSSGTSTSQGTSYAQGTSESQGTNESESGGSSKAQSEGWSKSHGTSVSANAHLW